LPANPQKQLEGLRIFAHLKDERLENLDFLKDFTFLERLDISIPKNLLQFRRCT
jgi:hypothetical protein